MNTLLPNRPYRNENDYTRILQLHRDIYNIVHGPLCCTAGELEWWRFQEDDPDAEIASAHLWESPDGTLIAYAWPNQNYMNLMVHPDHPELYETILKWAEEQIQTHATEPTQLTTEAVDSNTSHIDTLKSRGYEPTDQSRDWRFRSLETELPEIELPTGYTIRHLDNPQDLKQRVSLTEHSYAVHLARAPTYCPELNLAVITPDNRFAAFCTVWLDEQNHLGVFEPVECLPEFRRRGLTRAMMTEGMHRLKNLGATEACIINLSNNLPAQKLYESLAFQTIGTIRAWKKQLD